MLWITRINGRVPPPGADLLALHGRPARRRHPELNRKMMAELAVADDGAFKALFDASSGALKDKPTATLKAA